MLATLALILAPAMPVDGWVAIEQPLVEGATRMGCGPGGRVSLEGGDESWTVRDDDVHRFESFTLYVQLRDGSPRRVRAFTPDCDVVDAERARKLELSPAQAVERIDAWLDARASRRVHSRLIASLAHIDHADADTVLVAEAENLGEGDRARDALFWLANRRGLAGREQVARHLGDDWPLEHRKQAVMALALSEHAAAFERVRQVARENDDAELRAHAVTALGITQAPGALADLHSIFLVDKQPQVRRQAIFGLAQLDNPAAADVLLEIARDSRHGELRRDALFWLAQMDGKRASDILDELIDGAY